MKFEAEIIVRNSSGCTSRKPQHCFLAIIASVRLAKLESYNELVCSSTASLARILDTRIARIAEEDKSLIHPFFFLSTFLQTSTITKSSKRTANCTKISNMQGLLQNYGDLSKEDKIRLCLRMTAIADVDIDQLHWRSVNSRRFLTMAKLSQSELSSWAMSVSSKGINSRVGTMISSSFASLDDVAIETFFVHSRGTADYRHREKWYDVDIETTTSE